MLFESLINKNAKCVYHDGPEVRVQRGKLVSVEEGFITLSTLSGTVCIKIVEIIKLREDEGNE